MVRQRLWTAKRDLDRKGGSESAVLLFAEKLGNISILCVFVVGAGLIPQTLPATRIRHEPLR